MPEKSVEQGTALEAPAYRRCFSGVAREASRLKPHDLPGAIGILSDRDKPGSIVGIAYEAGHLGGWRTDWTAPGWPTEDFGPIEATWRLVIGKAEVEGRFVLRKGEFVELAEDAE